MHDPRLEPDQGHDEWLEELPDLFCSQVIAPTRFVRHVDDMAHASKVVGLDAHAQRCYVRHLHTQVEERFDIDEFPLQVAVRRERRIAWRLLDGRWLLQVDRIDRLDRCRPHLEHADPVLVPEAALGF